MEPLTEYLQLARQTSAAEFQKQHPYLFLFKHPKAARPRTDPRQYVEPVNTRPNKLDFDPAPEATRLVPLRKKPDQPFPDRLSIGRSDECDVVIRMAFISKVHAHLFVQAGGKVTLRDNNASNSTFHNGRKLAAGEARSVKLGDTLSFGGLEFELMDAARLHELLRKRTD
jgi:FHA domain-containing protein